MFSVRSTVVFFQQTFEFLPFDRRHVSDLWLDEVHTFDRGAVGTDRAAAVSRLVFNGILFLTIFNVFVRLLSEGTLQFVEMLDLQLDNFRHRSVFLAREGMNLVMSILFVVVAAGRIFVSVAFRSQIWM